jgi:hypothetical protein
LAIDHKGKVHYALVESIIGGYRNFEDAIIFTFDVGDDANIDPMDVPNAITSSVAWPVLLLEEVL